jgi:hypothetical protein
VPGSRRLAAALLVGTLVAYAVDAALEQVTASVDLWWHLASGRWIVTHREVPRVDVFSFTCADCRWFNPEWLSQVLYFTLYRTGGGTALAVCKLVVAPAAILLAAWLGWRRSGSLGLSAGAGIVAAILCRPFLDIRPDLFLYPTTVTVMVVLDAYRAGARPAVLGLLPVILLMWVNLHGSFAYGLGLVGLFALAELAKATFSLPDAPMSVARARWLIVAAAGSTLATLVNPEHVRALTFPFLILDPHLDLWRSGILEWTPPVLFASGDFNPSLLGWFLLGEAAVIVAMLVMAPRRLDLADTSLVVVTALMVLRARRFVPLLALVSVPFLARNLAVLQSQVLPRRAADPARRRRLGEALAAVL